jgi:hypothetical protein
MMKCFDPYNLGGRRVACMLHSCPKVTKHAKNNPDMEHKKERERDLERARE